MTVYLSASVPASMITCTSVNGCRASDGRLVSRLTPEQAAELREMYTLSACTAYPGLYHLAGKRAPLDPPPWRDWWSA